MSMIKVSNLTFNYETHPDNIFENVYFVIDDWNHFYQNKKPAVVPLGTNKSAKKEADFASLRGKTSFFLVLFCLLKLFVPLSVFAMRLFLCLLHLI